MNSPNFKSYHPIWWTLHWLLMIAGVALVLYITATEFDETEWKAIGGSGLVVAIGSVIAAFRAKKQGNESGEDS